MIFQNIRKEQNQYFFFKGKENFPSKLDPIEEEYVSIKVWNIMEYQQVFTVDQYIMP